MPERLSRFLLLGWLLAACGFYLPLGAQRSVSLANLDYVSLGEVAGKFGMQATWQTPEKELRVSGESARLDFTAASREIRINGMRVFLGEPVLLHRKQLYISRLDFQNTLQPVLTPQIHMPAGGVRTIAIDPGHGGRDSGTTNRPLELREKDLTLAVAQRLKVILEQQGYRVVLTRDRDTFVSLEDRSALAVAARADLFISIHFNAVDNPAVRGAETYILTPRTHRSTGQQIAGEADAVGNPGNQHDHWNAVLGYLVHRQLLRDLGAFDRGLKRARFAVLRGVNCPAVLVEAGYVSSPEEAARIATTEYQDELVRSLALAINRYRQATEKISAGGH